MPEELICHRMSGVVPTPDDDHNSAAFEKVECRGDGCALWDSLLVCCGDFSPVLEGRTQIRSVIGKIVGDMAGALERKVEVRNKLIDNLKELGAYGVEGQRDKMLVRYAEVSGHADMLKEVISTLRKRFGV